MSPDTEDPEASGEKAGEDAANKEANKVTVFNRVLWSQVKFRNVLSPTTLDTYSLCMFIGNCRNISLESGGYEIQSP